jgi:hypothetical protein
MDVIIVTVVVIVAIFLLIPHALRLSSVRSLLLLRLTLIAFGLAGTILGCIFTMTIANEEGPFLSTDIQIG